MAQYRDAFPQLSSRMFLTDGGLETTLVFHKKMALRRFAAFNPLKGSSGGKNIPGGSAVAAVAGWFVRLVPIRRWRKAHPRPDRLPDYVLKDIGLSRVEFEFGTGGRILDAHDSALFRG